jgi:hypothetical protein
MPSSAAHDAEALSGKNGNTAQLASGPMARGLPPDRDWPLNEWEDLSPHDG